MTFLPQRLYVQLLKLISMNNKIYFVFALFAVYFFSVAKAGAQMLEEVNFSPNASLHFDTYVTGINDSGFICGYYQNTAVGETQGFILSAKGKISRLYQTGYNIKVLSINEQKTSLVMASNASGTTYYKAYWNNVTDTIASLVAISNFQQNNCNALGINNKNDITGWYQGATNRWLFNSNDSTPLPLGSNAWNASRYMYSTIYYNTMAYATNDNGKTCGFYINGNVIAPFVYEAATNNYTVLNTSFKMKLYDINNSDMVVGEYQQANGFYTSFWGQVLGTGIIQVHSMNSLFSGGGNPIHSMANSINNKGEIVGAYQHPQSGAWVGFIYRPNQQEYRMPGFNFANHSWKLKNSDTGVNAVWTPNYYSNFNYTVTDPYVPAAGPLVDNLLALKSASVNIQNMPDSLCVSWKAFATERNLFTGSIPAYFIRKQLEFDKYRRNSRDFAGLCWGFTYASLLRAYDDANFTTVFNQPVNSNLTIIGNTNSDAILGIERMFLKQSDKLIFDKYSPDKYMQVSMWGGLYHLKNEFMKPQSACRPYGVGLSFNIKEHHSVLGYKIRTPRYFPFNFPVQQYDTLFIYDSNEPLDSTEIILVNSSLVGMAHDSILTTYVNPPWINFNQPTIQEIIATPNAQLKTTAIGDNSDKLTFSFNKDAYYHIIDQASATINYDQNGLVNNSNNITPIVQVDTRSKLPNGYLMDTTAHAIIATTHYTTSAMTWEMDNTLWSMGLNRIATVAEEDHATFKNKLISFGNSNTTTKTFTGYYNEINNANTMGVNIVVTGLSVSQGDSIITESPSSYQYKVRRIIGTSSTYNLVVYINDNDTLKQFQANNITLASNAAHTIEPYYNDNGKIKCVVKVDVGNDGNNDDTLFLNPTALSAAEVVAPSKLTIKPNPATTAITVTVTASVAEEVGSLLITDMQGRVVYSNQNMFIGRNEWVVPIEEYPSATYFLTILGKDGKVLAIQKFIKQ